MQQKINHYLLLMVMIYMTVDLSSMVFAYKIIEFGPIVAAASSLIFPLTYSIMDIVAEVYGYSIAKKMVLYGFICDLIFATLVLSISHIPSTTSAETQSYIVVLGSLLRVVAAQTLGVLSGAFINIYLISKWKVMTRGRYFWLRSIGSSTIGEAVMLVISVLIALVGVLPLAKIAQLIVYTYLYKVLFAIVAAPFVSLAAILLKHQNDIAISKPHKPDFSPSFQSH